MVTDSALWLKAATTIAVRFLALRRQGEPLATKSKDSSDARSSDPAALARSMEPQILDYGTVQTRLMPLVATAYALNFTSKFMMSIAAPPGLKGDDSLEDETSSSGAPASEPANGEEDHEAVDLKDIHATCAGLKAFCTWSTYYGIDTCRQCIGGHGYSACVTVCATGTYIPCEIILLSLLWVCLSVDTPPLGECSRTLQSSALGKVTTL